MAFWWRFTLPWFHTAPNGGMSQAPAQDFIDPRPAAPAATIHLAMAQVGSVAGTNALRQWATQDDQDSSKRPDSLLGRALLRGVLAGCSPLASDRWQIVKSSSGRPLVTGSGAMPSPSVSLSHSGGWSACAVSFDGEVGIDIETMRRDRNFTGIAGRAFGALECAEVEAEGCARFYAIWTLREAIAKAVGTGLAMVADGKDRVPGAIPDDFYPASIDHEPWQIMQRVLDTGLSLAIALRGAAVAPRLQWWSAVP
jgi:phosphopantetheinyl transferase